MDSPPHATPPRSNAIEPAHLVRVLALTTFLLWLGASALLPLLPLYLRRHGATDAVVGAVMGSYFAAAVLSQYLSGRLADRIGRRRVLIGGLVCYAIGSVSLLIPVTPIVDIAFRGLQGVGAGAAEVASLAMISSTIALEERGRAFGSIYGAQLGAMGIGPVVGSLVGLASFHLIFIAAGLTALVAAIPALSNRDMVNQDIEQLRARTHTFSGGLPSLNRALSGSLVAAAALGLIIGVYESCWTLLLRHRGAANWQIGLSWTMFALPFAVMSRPGGWLADHVDRRKLAVGGLLSSAGFCLTYPFLSSRILLLVLGSVEALGMAVTLPAVQSLLTQASPASELGRVQGLFSTSETGAIALSAACGGALFSVAIWAPFLFGGLSALALVGVLSLVWRPVIGRVARAQSHHDALPQAPTVRQS
jgi:DHA1 family multidrug resistance protein-like MFS transporter